METYPFFGVVMRRLRQDRKLSQEELASLMDMTSHAHISRLESGHKQPTLEMVFRLAKALGITAAEIVHEVEKVRGENL